MGDRGCGKEREMEMEGAAPETWVILIHGTVQMRWRGDTYLVDGVGEVGPGLESRLQE